MKKAFVLLGVLFCTFQYSYSQGSPDYSGGFKIKFNEDGSKYLRLITWAQTWAQYNDAVAENESNTSLSVRRARVLAFSQINKDFLILTHFGLNSLTADTQSPTGKGDGSQIFLHGTWGQYSIGSKHAIGGGLHYWNGISRLNNQSTLNMLTLDNNRQSWATIGLSDQFARHIGVYAKGSFGKLQYRVAINESATTTLDKDREIILGNSYYLGRQELGSKDSGKNFSGYFDFNFLDQESNFLPYKVGSYLGAKKVFNIGAGFFYHPNGSVIANTDGTFTGQNVSILAIDAFYDAPLGNNGSALTAYASFQNNNYGQNYNLGAYSTGTMFYSHVGYVIPNNNKKVKFQPYLSFNNISIDAIDDNSNRLGLGANAFFNGHNSKLSLEYTNTKVGNASATNLVTLQAMIYL